MGLDKLSMTKNLLKYCHDNENKYVVRSRISEAKFRQIILLFSENLSATQISHLIGLIRQTINKYLTAVRLRILKLSTTGLAPIKRLEF